MLLDFNLTFLSQTSLCIALSVGGIKCHLPMPRASQTAEEVICDKHQSFIKDQIECVHLYHVSCVSKKLESRAGILVTYKLSFAQSVLKESSWIPLRHRAIIAFDKTLAK